MLCIAYDRDSAREHLASIRREASSFETEFRIRRKDGVYVWHQARGNAVLEGDGSVREWVGICVDIDDRKQAAEQRELLNRSVEQALGLLVSVSAAASAAYTISELASAALERICNAQRWQFAQVWHRNDQIDRLFCSGTSVWNAIRVCRISPPQRRTPQLRWAKISPAASWDIKTANWFEDIGFAKLPRLRAACDAGLKTALVFPVILGDEVLAVFEFFSTQQTTAEPHHARRG